MLSLKFISIIFTVLALSSIVHAQYDYCEVLRKSLLFYEAQKSGRLPSTNRIPWRGNSALTDCTSISCVLSILTGDGNLAGGYYDAGDGVKFLFPAAFTTTTLAWGFIEFQSAIDACGETQNYLNVIRWSTDFIMSAHTSPNELWGQVGNGGIDHSFWGAPELMRMSRPSYKITTSNPGTELAMEAASALAASAIAFKNFDASYSNTMITHARQLYSFGYNYRGSYSDSIPDAGNYYKSYGYNDELVWGSTWLYRATGEANYLNTAKSDYVTYGMKNFAPGQAFSWDQKAPGVVVNMYKITGDPQYLADAQNWMNSWYQGRGMTYTPGGLVWYMQWGPLRYSAGVSFLALVISNSASNTWAQGQINYMLGSNPSKRSYVCGFGNNPPINPHHRAAHGSTTNNIYDPVNNLHILTGALVGGPDSSDNYVDDRTDYVKNEVALDYNAGFTAAVAGLAKLAGSSVTSAPVTATPTTAPTTTTTTPFPKTTQANTPPSAATNRPSSAPTTTTTAAPTTPTTSSSTSPPASTSTTPIAIQMSSGSSAWWFAVTVLNGKEDTAKVEFSDSGAFQSYQPMLPTNWGYWTFSPNTMLTAPITLRLTSSSGAQVVLTNVLASLSNYAPVATSKQYGTASATTRNAPVTRSPTTTNSQPTTTNSQPTTTNSQPTTTNSQPTNSQPTAHDSGDKLTLKVHQGASEWWLAVAVRSAEGIINLSVKDANADIASAMTDGGWGYWILESKGTPFALPLTFTSISNSGKTATFVVSYFGSGVIVDAQY